MQESSVIAGWVCLADKSNRQKCTVQLAMLPSNLALLLRLREGIESTAIANNFLYTHEEVAMLV